MTMKTINDSQCINFVDPIWYFLIEYPLNELIADIDVLARPKTRLLIKTIMNLGVRQELLNNIMRKLMTVARGVTPQPNHSGCEETVYLRLYCPKEASGDERSTKPTIPFVAGPIRKFTHMNLHSDHGINRRWDYFMIERGGRSQTGSTVGVKNWIDMYLYKEGE